MVFVSGFSEAEITSHGFSYCCDFVEHASYEQLCAYCLSVEVVRDYSRHKKMCANVLFYEISIYLLAIVLMTLLMVD